MRFMPDYLVKNETFSGTDRTIIIPLPKNEQISFIQVEISALNNASTPPELITLIDQIDNYEVIADGSKVLYSLEPELAYYIDFITNKGIYPPHSFNYVQGQRCTHQFIIPFGREMFDEEYMLDTNLYNNVQLRIPISIDTDIIQTGSIRLNVVIWRPMEKLSPIGLIRSRTFQKETSGSAVETINHDIPMELPLRYLAARFEDIDTNITADVTAIRLNFGAGRFILLDQNINEIRDFDKVRFPEKNYYWITAAIQSQTLIKAHTDYPYPRQLLSSATQPIIFRLYWAIGEQVGMYMIDVDGAEWTSKFAVSLGVSGPNPHKCITLIDGRKDPLFIKEYDEGRIEYTMTSNQTILHTFGQEIVTGKLY